jgi:DNA-binding transcriptional regulator of glucitol operon
MDARVWFSRRALKLHAVILIVVPGFLALCFWQVSRALGGNTLSWAYVFEWPLFAGYAVYMWWRLVHEAPEGTPPPASADNAAGGPDASAAADPASSARQAEEDAELAAYNAYLAQLAERDAERNNAER